MDVRTINNSIIHGTWTNAELSSMIDSIKFARKRLGERTKADLMLGDNVTFTSNRTGRSVTGHVVKIAVKNVTVRTLDGLWKVPANMLTRVPDFAFED